MIENVPLQILWLNLWNKLKHYSRMKLADWNYYKPYESTRVKFLINKQITIAELTPLFRTALVGKK